MPLADACGLPLQCAEPPLLLDAGRRATKRKRGACAPLIYDAQSVLLRCDETIS
jgi:hypothetical protein